MTNLLRSLPFGGWLADTPFGMVYGTFIFSALSCCILLLTKLIFKTYFPNKTRKILFLVFAAGSSLLISACFIYLTIKMSYFIYTYDVALEFGYLLPVYHRLTLIAYLFFIGYLLDFIIRLVRHLRKRRTDGSAATPTN